MIENGNRHCQAAETKEELFKLNSTCTAIKLCTASNCPTSGDVRR